METKIVFRTADNLLVLPKGEYVRETKQSLPLRHYSVLTAEGRAALLCLIIFFVIPPALFAIFLSTVKTDLALSDIKSSINRPQE